MGTKTVLAVAWIPSKKEVSPVVVKAFKRSQIFPLPDDEFGQNCGVLELEWDQSVAGLVAARTFTTLTLVLGHWPSPRRRKQ